MALGPDPGLLGRRGQHSSERLYKAPCVLQLVKIRPALFNSRSLFSVGTWTDLHLAVQEAKEAKESKDAKEAKEAKDIWRHASPFQIL